MQPQLSSNSQVFLSKKAAGKRKEFSVSPTDQRFDSSHSQSLPPDSIPSTRKKAKLNNSISFDKTSSDTRKNLEITTIPETAPERSVAGPSFKNYQDSSATLTSTSSIESNRKATILAFLALKDDEILDLVGELGTESMQRLVNLGAQAGKTFRGGNRKKVLKSSEI